VDLLNSPLWAGRKGPATYTRYFALGMQLSPALQSPFLSTWGAVMLEKKQTKKNWAVNLHSSHWFLLTWGGLTAWKKI